MNKKVSSTSSKKNKKKDNFEKTGKFFIIIANCVKLLLLCIVILLSIFMFVLSFGDIFALAFDKDYKITKANITDTTFNITGDKFKDYRFFKYEVSYEFTKDNQDVVNAKDVIISPSYYLIHKYKDTTYVVYNIEDDKKNHIFQVYLVHFVVSIILLYISFIEIKRIIKHKALSNI